MTPTITVPLQTVIQADKAVQEYIDKVVDKLVDKINSDNLLEDIERYKHSYCEFQQKPTNYQVLGFIRARLDLNYVTRPTVFDLLAK